MTCSTAVGELFSPCHTMDILLYIADHPYCKKTDIYRNVTRNSSIPGRIQELADAGLVEIRQYGRVTILNPTSKGIVVSDMIRTINLTLSDGFEGPEDA